MPQRAATTESTAYDAACIPSNYSRLIAQVLALQVRDLPSLMNGTGLTTNQFMQEDTLLTTHQQVQILENGLLLSRDPAFGLRLGQRLTPSTHGAMGFLANSSPNLLTALEAFQTFLPTRLNFARLELTRTRDSVKCSAYFDLALTPAVHRALAETFAVVFFECAEFIVGRPLSEATTYFAHEQPSYGSRYPDYLPGQLAFSASELTVQLPLSLCHVPNASANRENYLLAMRQCETMLAQLRPDSQRSTTQIQRLMLSQAPGALTEQQAAAALFVSKRTLARRLEKEGTGFRQIRDDILSRQAIDYLTQTRMPVNAIAALLDYHDSANFRRAFKRWHQLTPAQYRQQANREHG